MPPKGQKKGPPAAPGGKKGPPPAMLAKILAQREAQRKADEEWERQQQEEERRRKEEERIAEEERKREEAEREAQKEKEKEAQKVAKVSDKRKQQIEALERMRAAGMIVPDLPVHEEGDKQSKEHHHHQRGDHHHNKKHQKKEEPKAPENTTEDAGLVDDWEALVAQEEAEESPAQPGEQAEGPHRESDEGSESVIGGLRSPICCVLGHVDTGKTSLLDRIRRTNVQGGEAGGITQQIGATFFPKSKLEAATEELNRTEKVQMNVPGLLVIDTPGHESFTNLRSRGSSLCDIAILVVDFTHGIEPQTKESIRLLRERQCPFIVALNKLDRLFDWKVHENMDVRSTLAKQPKHVINEFETRLQTMISEFNAEGFNAALYYDNKDVKTYVSLVPTSARTGEGISDLLLLQVQLVQRFMESKVSYQEELKCVVLEVKPVQGVGTTIDVILVSGELHAGDRIVVCGILGPIVTTIRTLLTPQPLKELRVRGEYVHHKTVRAALGIKIVAPDLEDAVPGAPLFVCGAGDDLEKLKTDVMRDLTSVISKVQKVGVAVQSSTLGSMEALLSFLEEKKIQVSHIALGPIAKRHLATVISMKEHHPKYAVMLAFDVPVTREAQEVAEKAGITIFTANIIYHLFDQFTKYYTEFEQRRLEEARARAVFPCALKINQVVRGKDPIILFVNVVRGTLRLNTPICLRGLSPLLRIGVVASMEKDHKDFSKDVIRTGSDICIKLEKTENLTFGRQFDEASTLVSLLSRDSIDQLKSFFRSEMSQDEWKLIIELKKEQGII